MSRKGRNILKEYFEAGKMPTEEEFSDLIDSNLNKNDDQLTVKTTDDSNPAKYLGVGSVDPKSRLSVRAHGQEEKLISFESPGGIERWKIGQNVNNSSGLNIGEEGVMDSQLFIASGSGNVGIETTEPTAKLHINGDFQLRVGEKVDSITNQISTSGDNYRDNVLPTERALQEYIDDLFAGSVAAFATEQVPEGWLECDGRAVSRSKYARLFSKIDVRYGIGDGATTFNVPDLRGVFIRGLDQGRGYDEWSSRPSGSFQDDAFQIHGHRFTGSRLSIYGGSHSHIDHNSSYWYNLRLRGGGSNTALVFNQNARTNHESHSHTFTPSGSIEEPYTSVYDRSRYRRINKIKFSDKETRPKNIALAYFIKI